MNPLRVRTITTAMIFAFVTTSQPAIDRFAFRNFFLAARPRPPVVLLVQTIPQSVTTADGI